MAHTNSWDETNPTNSTLATSIDDEIRKLRKDARERLAVDHNLTSSDAGAATVGQHKQITFADDIADPTTAGDVSCIYTKKLSSGSNVVPFFRNSVDGIARVLLGDSYFKVWLYSATAPVGMKASSSPPSDMCLAAVGGSTYTTAGGTAGSWTISGLTHAHTHSGTTDVEPFSGRDEGGGSDSCAQVAHTHTFTTSSISGSTVSSAGTWRVAAAVNKLYEPDLTV